MGKKLVTIPLPQVSAKDLDAAKRALEIEGQRKKTRSSMSHWLMSQGHQKTFDQMTMMEKKTFMENWLHYC